MDLCNIVRSLNTMDNWLSPLRNIFLELIFNAEIKEKIINHFLSFIIYQIYIQNIISFHSSYLRKILAIIKYVFQIYIHFTSFIIPQKIQNFTSFRIQIEKSIFIDLCDSGNKICHDTEIFSLEITFREINHFRNIYCTLKEFKWINYYLCWYYYLVSEQRNIPCVQYG